MGFSPGHPDEGREPPHLPRFGECEALLVIEGKLQGTKLPEDRLQGISDLQLAELFEIPHKKDHTEARLAAPFAQKFPGPARRLARLRTPRGEEEIKDLRWFALSSRPHLPEGENRRRKRNSHGLTSISRSLPKS
jgi:hypothetical protein